MGVGNVKYKKPDKGDIIYFDGTRQYSICCAGLCNIDSIGTSTSLSGGE